MKRIKKALASLAIAGMALTLIPLNVLAEGAVPTRLGGYTAAQTAVQIAEQTGWTGTAILSSSTSYGMVDALTAGPLATFLKAPMNEEITQNNEGKNLKYEYQVNTNILIGKLKDSMVLMLLEDNSEKRNSMFHRVMQEISKNMVPIRPGRSKIRKMGLKAHKHPMNQKRCL